MQKNDLTPEQRSYQKKIKRKIAVLVLVTILAIIGMTSISVAFFSYTMNKELDPQLQRAIRQVSELLPQLQQNEEALRSTYDEMLESRIDYSKTIGFPEDADVKTDQLEMETLIEDTLSWMDRVTRLKVGRNGIVYVYSNEDNTILAHPNKDYIGKTVRTNRLFSRDILDISDSEQDLTALRMSDYRVLTLLARGSFSPGEAIRQIFEGNYVVYGVPILYRDTTIFCGIPFSELLDRLIRDSALMIVFFGVLLGLFVKWITLVIHQHTESPRSFRSKLLYTMGVLCAIMLFGSWYMQLLSDVSSDLRTMENHAEIAVETLNTYSTQRNEINAWLDQQYLTQCRMAADLVKNTGAKNISRELLKEWAEKLKVKYIYVFDKNGKTIVTNSPYDHFEISQKEEDQSYAFQPLLAGREYVIQQPMPDEASGEELQYIGVSLRDEKDLSNGFVQIAVDTTLRDRLISPLGIDTVISNLVIGLPEHAIAVDKNTLEITATTGIGFQGQKVEELGITEEKLRGKYNGFLEINGKTYYAGVGESEELFLVPVVVRKSTAYTVLGSLEFTAYLFLISLIVISLTLFHYEQDVLKGFPGESEEEPEEEKEEASEEEDDWGIARNFRNLFRTKEKWMFKERWKVHTEPKGQQSPETRMQEIIYRLLLLFCVLVLIPNLYMRVSGSTETAHLSAFSYVISGNWEKGVNIFAFTSCVFLLCGMYVFVLLINWILYQIARVSDTRVETVCLLLKSSLKYICVVIFIYYGLAQFGIDTRTLLASAGILGLIISLGAKDLVADVIAGFFIIFEGTFAVGDYVTIGRFNGTVMSIGIRTTRIVRFSEYRIMYNSTIRELSNWNGETGRAKIVVPISYKTDLLAVENILNEELPKLYSVISHLQSPPAYKGVEELGDKGVMLRIQAYCDGYSVYQVARSLSREVKLIFDRYHISIPYPVMEIQQPEEDEIRKVPAEPQEEEKESSEK